MNTRRKILLIPIIAMLLSLGGCNNGSTTPSTKFTLTTFKATNSHALSKKTPNAFSLNANSNQSEVYVNDTHALEISFNNPENFTIKSITLNNIVYTYEDFLKGSTNSKIIIALPVVNEEENRTYQINKVIYLNKDSEEVELELDEELQTKLNIHYEEYDPNGSGEVTLHIPYSHSFSQPFEDLINMINSSKELLGNNAFIKIKRHGTLENLIHVYNQLNQTGEIYNGAHMFIAPGYTLAEFHGGVSYQDFSSLVSQTLLDKLNPICLKEGYNLTGINYGAIPLFYYRDIAIADKEAMESVFGKNHKETFLTNINGLFNAGSKLKALNQYYTYGIGIDYFSKVVEEKIYNLNHPMFTVDEFGLTHCNLLNKDTQNDLKNYLDEIKDLLENDIIATREKTGNYQDRLYVENKIPAYVGTTDSIKYAINEENKDKTEFLPVSLGESGKEEFTSHFIIGLSTSYKNDQHNMGVLINKFLLEDNLIRLSNYNCIPATMNYEKNPLFIEALKKYSTLQFIHNLNIEYPLNEDKVFFRKYSPIHSFFNNQSYNLFSNTYRYGSEYAINKLLENYIATFNI